MSNDVIVMNGELSERANRSGLSSPLFCEASPSYTSYRYESEEERNKRLGIDPNYKWATDISSYEGVKDGLVTVSYQTILKYVGIALAVILVFGVLWYYYKKMK